MVIGEPVVMQVDSVMQTVNLTLGDNVSALRFILGGGDDSMSILPGMPGVSVNGGGGSDTLIANNSVGDTLHGGGGAGFHRRWQWQ